MDVIKIAELNVNVGNSKSDTQQRKLGMMENILDKENFDVCFFTECNLSDQCLNEFINKSIFLEKYDFYCNNEIFVAILKKNENNAEEYKKNSPSMTAIDIKKNDKKMTIAGVRFLLSATNKGNYVDEYIKQIKNYLDVIHENKFDIVIGDFNWDTAIIGRKHIEKLICEINEAALNNVKLSSIESSIADKEIQIKRWGKGYVALENYENTFCKMMNKYEKEPNLEYDIWPRDKKMCSYVKGKSKSSPDRVIWRKVLKPKNIIYKSGGEDYNQEWPFDHQMIIAEFIIKE